MCGVIGVFIKDPTLENLWIVPRLFQESKIRGLHASGLSWADETGSVRTIKGAFGADVLIQNHLRPEQLMGYVGYQGSAMIIGHCRYSTSDLAYNQPIQIGNVSIVHNGVVSQAKPEDWGVECETRNDSELLLRAEDPLRKYPNASVAAIELQRGIMRFYRNGKRPLWTAYDEDNVILLASTRDILQRAGAGRLEIEEVDPWVYHKVEADGNILIEKVEHQGEDLQC